MKKKKGKSKEYINALLGIFPTTDAYFSFKEDNAPITNRAIPEFVRFAHETGLSKRETENDLITAIEKYSANKKESNPLKGFIFEDLIKDVTEGSSVNTLITELNVIARQFKMSDVQGSMFSRLKRDFHLNTPAKRNCIRILSFWIGKNRPLLEWNYEAILKIPRGKEIDGLVEEQEGARIAFRLEGRGEIIDTDVVEWLKNELAKCITELKLYHIDLKRITCFATTIFLTIDKHEGPSGEPRLFESAIRDSLVIAHQLLNRFYLSDYSSKQKALIIAMDAGSFTNLDASLQVLMEVKLPEDPAIRVTSFVRLCSRLSDNRVIFSKTSKELKSANGSILTVWYVECLWSFYYYDFIPCLLEDDMLPTTRKSHDKFVNALYYSFSIDTVNLKALSAIYKFPENDMLILEIAKVCVARRMFRAANNVLSIILASNPNHIVARTFRMSIYMDLAMEQDKYSLFELFYLRAIEEGLSITETCLIEDEEFYCEFGTVYFLTALRMLSFLRDNNKTAIDKGKVNIHKILEFLESAEALYRRGTVFSPPGIGKRCNFLQLQTRCFIVMLETDESICSPGKPLIDINNVYESTGIEVIDFLGWTDLPFLVTEDSLKNRNNIVEQVNSFLDQILNLFQMYESSMLFRLSFPNKKFVYAAMVFDFSPFITVRMVKKTISWLEEARVEAEKLKKDKIGVYVILSCYGRIHNPESYIKFIDKTITSIKNIIGWDLQRDDDYIIDKKKFSGFKLMLLGLEDKVETGILV